MNETTQVESAPDSVPFDLDDPVTQSLSLIDEKLSLLADRSMISANEVADLLLDLRLLLAEIRDSKVVAANN